jgi:hypothetical protein
MSGSGINNAAETITPAPDKTQRVYLKIMLASFDFLATVEAALPLLARF